MKIESGKFYRTRIGRKARVYVTDHPDSNYPIVGTVDGTLVTWTLRGHFSANTVTCNSDLIAEWVDKPEIDRSILPAWANKAVAMDASGRWMCYDGTPIPGTGYWISRGHNYLQVPTPHAPKWTGDWKDSLIVFED